MGLLEDLLRYLTDDRVRTLGELAVKLDVDPALLAQMLRDLERAGYVRSVEAACTRACDGCAANQSCGIHLDGRIWSVMPKAWDRVSR